jgi:hypothetical protein
MTPFIRRIHFHKDRAERFKEHASASKSPENREMYLRLSAQELALAECLDAQVRVEAEVEDGIPAGAEESRSSRTKN